MLQKGSSHLGDLLRSWPSCHRFLPCLILALAMLGWPTHHASAVTAYRALVMRATLLDSVPSKSRATINDMFFTNAKGIAKLYEDTSYGQATWTGTTIDVSINYSTTDGSNSGQWCDAADAQARAQGYEPNNYDAKVFISDAGGGASYATGNGGTNRVYITYSGDLVASAHEIGHGIALDHASTDFNNDGVVDDEYGDNSDTMGGGGYAFDAPHRVQKGWLAPTVITANGTYTVAPVEQTSGARVFRYNPSSGQSYFFSYRQPIGFDGQTTWWDGAAKTPIGAPFTNGLNIHRFQGPGDQDNTLEIIQPLQDGGSYTIPGTSVVIKQTSHNGSGTTFTVSGIGTSAGGFTGAGTYRLTPYAAASSALNVPGFATGNPNSVQTVIWAWDGGTNEKFNFVSLGGGLYKIQCAFDTNQVLDAYGAGDNAQVGVWTDNGQNQQKWQVVDAGGGYYNLKPQNAPTKALDNANGSAANNNGQVIYASSNNNNQKWKFTKQ